MCVEEDRTVACDTPLEPTNAYDNSVLDRYDDDEEDVLAPNHDVDSVPYDMYDDATTVVLAHDHSLELCSEEADLVDRNKLEI